MSGQRVVQSHNANALVEQGDESLLLFRRDSLCPHVIEDNHVGVFRQFRLQKFCGLRISDVLGLDIRYRVEHRHEGSFLVRVPAGDDQHAELALRRGLCGRSCPDEDQ